MLKTVSSIPIGMTCHPLGILRPTVVESSIAIGIATPIQKTTCNTPLLFSLILFLGPPAFRRTAVVEYGLAKQLVELCVPESCSLAQADWYRALVL
jgi:hypothetical protein